MNDRKPVWVKWIDSFGGGGWQSPEDIARCLTCESIGWLVGEDEHAITISTSVSLANGDVIDPLTIPKVAIQEYFEIEWK